MEPVDWHRAVAPGVIPPATYSVGLVVGGSARLAFWDVAEDGHIEATNFTYASECGAAVEPSERLPVKLRVPGAMAACSPSPHPDVAVEFSARPSITGSRCRGTPGGVHLQWYGNEWWRRIDLVLPVRGVPGRCSWTDRHHSDGKSRCAALGDLDGDTVSTISRSH